MNVSYCRALAQHNASTIVLARVDFALLAMLDNIYPTASEFDAGPGLVFAHPGTIVLTGRASVGAFFTIYHCCAVGTTHPELRQL